MLMLNVLNVGSVLLVIYELQYDCVNWSQVLFPFLEFWIIWAGRCLTDRCYCNILIQERRLRIDRLKMLLIDRNDSMYVQVCLVCLFYVSVFWTCSSSSSLVLVSRREKQLSGIKFKFKIAPDFSNFGGRGINQVFFLPPLCCCFIFSLSFFLTNFKFKLHVHHHQSINHQSSHIYHTPLYNETDWLTVVGWHSTHSDKECHLEASLLQHTTEQTL